MAESTFRRMEKKMLLPTEDVPRLLERFNDIMEPDPHNKDGAPYMLCNLYFDDRSRHVIRNSVERPFYKEKLRLRSYGVPTDDSPVFLEIKKKTDGVGTKRRARIPLSDAMRFLETGIHPNGISYIDEQVLREIDYYRSHHEVFPSTYVSYLRNAYISKEDPTFRVTVDRDILTRHHDLDLRLGRYGESILPPEITLMEVKFAGAVPLWFARLMSEFKASFHTFSKYGTDFKIQTYREVMGDDEAYPSTLYTMK